MSALDNDKRNSAVKLFYQRIWTLLDQSELTAEWIVKTVNFISHKYNQDHYTVSEYS